MLEFAARVAPGAEFVVGAAEALPVGDPPSISIAAAGSLNYVDLTRFFAEASRVLTADGVLLVYDFSAGKSFRDGPALDAWFARFFERYPPPALEARELESRDPGARGRAIPPGRARGFRNRISLTPQFYLDYVLTETNVSAAVREEKNLAGIRKWCAETLAPVWRGEVREVLFRGYFACLRPTAPGS